MFTTNTASVSALQELHLRLEHELNGTKAEASELLQNLSQIWGRLQIYSSYRNEFRATHRGHSGDTLNAVHEEIK
jgi:hypothetical protein